MMVERIRHALRFFDWKFFTAVASCGLVIAIIISEINLYSVRQRARIRIDGLNEQIIKEQDLIRDNAEQIGQLTADVDALSQQVKQLGGKPIATHPTTTSTTTSPNQQPGSRSGASSTTTMTRKSPGTTTTTRSCLLGVLCL